MGRCGLGYNMIRCLDSSGLWERRDVLKKLVIAGVLSIGLVTTSVPATAQTDPETVDPFWQAGTFCDQGVCNVYECPTVGLAPCRLLYTYDDPLQYTY